MSPLGYATDHDAQWRYVVRPSDRFTTPSGERVCTYRASAISIACYMQSPVLATVELSVCLSVCHTLALHCVKTTQARITKPSPSDGQRILVIWQ